MKPSHILILLLILTSKLNFAQEYLSISGRIKSEISDKGIPFASVNVDSTNKGTYTAKDGTYLLKLKPGNYRLRFYSIGYQAVYIEIKLNDNIDNLDVTLELADYELEDVVVYAEGPGMRTMRKVINRKLEQRDSLKSYEYRLYTKLIVANDTITAGRADDNRDTTITSILETYADSYFKAPDKYYSEVIQKRQSINIPPQANSVAFDNKLNIYDDEVKILTERIISPFHPDAPDFYDFELEAKIKVGFGKKISKIKVTPKNDGRKLFEGYVYIDSVNLMPVNAVLKPNKSVRLPFNAKMDYYQEFMMIDNYFIMPSGLQLNFTMDAEIFWVYSPRLDVELTTMQYSYKINKEIDNDKFQRRSVEIRENADENNEEFWVKNELIPLREEEKRAYGRIYTQVENPDSIQGTNFFQKQIQPITKYFRWINRPPFTGTSEAIKYNRVTGLQLGLGVEGQISNRLDGDAYLGYGFAAKRHFIDFGIKYYLDKNKQFSIAARGQDDIVRMGNKFLIRDQYITSLAFFFRNDPADYYYKRGFDLTAQYGWGQKQFVRPAYFEHPFRLLLTYSNQEDFNAEKNTDFAIFRTRPFREDPPAINGMNRYLKGEIYLDYNRERTFSDFGAYFSYEISDPKYLASSFDYRRYYAEMSLSTRSILPLWRLNMILIAGYSEGDLPPQKYFALEGVAGLLSAGSAFRTLRPKEFYGDQFYAITMEHSFGEIFPGLIRIPSVASFGLEFLLLGNVGWTDFRANSLAFNNNQDFQFNYTHATQDQYFYELGFGINRLFIFFRFDVSARFTQRDQPEFRFTIKGATFN